MATSNTKKCSTCTTIQNECAFKRKGKLFKTCNKCHDYRSNKYSILKQKKKTDLISQPTCQSTTPQPTSELKNTPPENPSEKSTSDTLSTLLDKLFATNDLNAQLVDKYECIKTLQNNLLIEVCSELYDWN